MSDIYPAFFLDQTLYDGRPSNLSGRLEKEIRTYDFLDKLGILYKRLDHSPMPSIADCQDVDKLLETEICKNLFLRNAQKTSFYLLLMPGEKKFKTAVLSKQIGSARLSFAEADYMNDFLDITPGSVSVLGLMNDKRQQVRLLIDREVLKQEFFSCHPCINTSSIKFKTSDLLNKILPAFNRDYTIVDLPCESE